jgi:Ni,Fe-hydrogenase maturation factor
LRYVNGDSAATHPGDAHELLSTAAFLGELPEHFYIVGMQAVDARQGEISSKAVRGEFQTAIECAQRIVDRWLIELAEPVSA